MHDEVNKLETKVEIVESVKDRMSQFQGPELVVANYWLPVIANIKGIYQDARTISSALGSAAASALAPLSSVWLSSHLEPLPTRSTVLQKSSK